MLDHYATLGVGKTATPDEIKRAYRKLASQHHPDRGGDTARFQQIQAAYDVLGDAQKRQQYDNPSPFGGGGQSPFGSGFHFNFGGPAGFNFNDMFEAFGQRRGPNQEFQRRNHFRMSLWVKLSDVATGGRRPVAVGNHTVEIDIPPGINDGDNVQYGGIGPNGKDLVIQFRVQPDPRWARDGLNLITEVSVSVWDLLLGSDLSVNDILGNQLVTSIAAKTQPRTMLRLRGKGLRDRSGKQGDILVRVNAEIPDTVHPEILEAIQKHRQ